ncbi:MAG: response regulator, partial [Leptolyngbyaceae bacterium]|nr:response regulator [Leptolyngbyaceae bacterium]
SPKLQHVLIIDNHPDHVQTIRDTLTQGNSGCDIVVITCPDEAIQYLRHQDQYANTPQPHLILLDPDLAMATQTQDGLTILATIKADPRLKRTPIVVLTLSDDTATIFNSYLLQGNCYVIKPSSLQELAHIVKRIEEFWLSIVTLPVE